MVTKTAPSGKGKTASKAKADEPKANKYHNCNCLHGTGGQCTEQTTRAFARGHDARMSSRLADGIASGDITKAQAAKYLKEAGGSDLLISKTHHSAELRAERDKAPAKAAAKKSAATAKKSTAKGKTEPAKEAPAQVIGRNVMIDHDENTEVRAVVVRNASEELVARHRHQGKNCDHPWSPEAQAERDTAAEEAEAEDDLDDEDEDDFDDEEEDED